VWSRALSGFYQPADRRERRLDEAMSAPATTTTRPQPWRNWAGDQNCAPVLSRTPATIEELAGALAEARREGLRVRVRGSGHSFSETALSDGMLIGVEPMRGVLDVDRSSGLVRVQAGITIHELNRALDGQGLALENLGDIDRQTIAGAISTATHGTGARLKNVSAQVADLTMVLADGSTLFCSPEADRDTFRAAQVGLGALGAIAEVTLRCVPAFTLRAIEGSAPLAQTLADFEQTALANEHFEFFVFPHCDTVLTRINNRVEEQPRPRSRTAAYLNDILLTNHTFGAICRVGRRAPRLIPTLNRLVTRLAGKSTRVDRSYEIFANPRLVRFTEMEYALPREHTSEAVRAVLEMIPARRFDVPFPIEVRTAAADTALLSTASERDTGFVAVHMFEGMDWRPYFEAVEEIMDGFGGRPHWGKRHFQTAASLAERYPHWQRFQEIRARLDPEGLFGNEWTDRVLGPVGASHDG
jgi:L-gulonolactone oxidase